MLAARIAGGGDPKASLTALRALRDGLDEAAVVGELVEAGEYTRPTEYAGESEEH